MDRQIFAHVKMIPKDFPEVVTIQYREASPADHGLTGKSYEEERSWRDVRACYTMDSADLDKRQEILRAGLVANFGFHYIIGDFAG